VAQVELSVNIFLPCIDARLNCLYLSTLFCAICMCFILKSMFGHRYMKVWRENDFIAVCLYFIPVLNCFSNPQNILRPNFDFIQIHEEVWRSWDIGLRILNNGIRWRRMIIFTLRPLYSWGKWPSYSWNKRPCGFQRQSELYEREENKYLAPNGNRTPNSSAVHFVIHPL
jgi:hypothetical protein